MVTGVQTCALPISGFASQAGNSALFTEHKAQLVQVIFGTLVILLLIFAPGGLAQIGRQLRSRLTRGSK